MSREFIRRLSVNVPPGRSQTLSQVTVPSVGGALHRRHEHSNQSNGSSAPQALPSNQTAVPASTQGPTPQAEPQLQQPQQQQQSQQQPRPQQPRPVSVDDDEEDESYLAGERHAPVQAVDPMRDGPLGFPNRIDKPKGVRSIPAAWGPEYKRTEARLTITIL